MSDAFNKYLNTYSGRRLLEKHNLSEDGFWNVRGEDPNCDLGGSHHQPFIGVFEGTLEDAIKWGVKQPNFWQWGGGGDFDKIDIERPDNLRDKNFVQDKLLQETTNRLASAVMLMEVVLKVKDDPMKLDKICDLIEMFVDAYNK